MHDSTRIVRSTLTRATAGEPLHPGPVFAAPFHTPGDPADALYSYARSHNPTWTALERCIGQIESGKCAPGQADEGQSFRSSVRGLPSGMAFRAAALFAS